jgi:hypothetical protein
MKNKSTTSKNNLNKMIRIQGHKNKIIKLKTDYKMSSKTIKKEKNNLTST